MKHMWIVVTLMAACGGAQKGGGGGDTDLCPATDAKVRDACGCRPTESGFVRNADNEGWGNPAQATKIREAARACATGQNGSKITECVKAAAQPDMGANIAMGMLVSSDDKPDETFLACSAKLAP